MLTPQVFVRACVLQLLKIRDSRLEVEFFCCGKILQLKHETYFLFVSYSHL